jgi:hypothetical protein
VHFQNGINEGFSSRNDFVAIMKGRPDAGQGGKRGHSNMDHWEFNDEIKEAARKRRRLDAKEQISSGLIESASREESEREQDPSVSQTD